MKKALDQNPIRRNDRMLIVKVSTEKRDPLEMFMHDLEPPEILPPQWWTVAIELEQDYCGYTCRSLMMKMGARYDGNDERFREELLTSKYLDSRGIGSECDRWDKSDSPIGVELIDPQGIIAWLFPKMDFNEFFNQQNLLSDKPVRLPSTPAQ